MFSNTAVFQNADFFSDKMANQNFSDVPLVYAEHNLLICWETRPMRPGFKGHPIKLMIILDPYLGPIWSHLNPFGPIRT